MLSFISNDRLDIYVSQLKVNKNQAIAAYYWNKSLGGAMFPAIQCLEVTLRNALDVVIQKYPPPGAAGLWHANHDWIFNLVSYMGKKAYPRAKDRYRAARTSRDNQDKDGYLLDRYGKRILAKKTNEELSIEKMKFRLIKEYKVVTPSRIIAGLSLGFWTTLLSAKYEDQHSHSLLWPNLTRKVFPHAPAHYTIKEIYQSFERVRELRNRLSHHEAIWKFYYDNPMTRKPDFSKPVYGIQASINLLRKHYQDMIEMIGWMDKQRQYNFIKHSANQRFYAICSVDGLNSYISPERIENQINYVRGGHGIRKVIKVLNRGNYIRIVENGSTIMSLGPDCIMVPK